MAETALTPPAALTIPDKYVAGFSKIIDLTPEESRLVANALGEAKSVSVRDLTSLVVENVPSLAAKDAREIVQTLLSLYSVRASAFPAEITVAQFVEALIAAAKQSERPLPPISAGAAESLATLLNVKTLSMISKARGIHTDHENTFCSARILTDMRPVFDVDVAEEPAGFVIAHMLKLGYHHGGAHKTIHIAMDKMDIDTMILVLERARAKADTLAKVIATKAGFTILAD